ncbi:hypothetical protein N7476_002863 [Penicillium atrosanguineum]|uniref:Uncharacterized protein n=1 Tax=Penicillium atrosanguineum TaxID=1132637 RepID=A0A9W9Q5W3_9EURO|nr:hypothetical protein N7476_002863 [Penicillium atrosanguineum]
MHTPKYRGEPWWSDTGSPIQGNWFPRSADGILRLNYGELLDPSANGSNVFVLLIYKTSTPSLRHSITNKNYTTRDARQFVPENLRIAES